MMLEGTKYIFWLKGTKSYLSPTPGIKGLETS